ncbi:MAG: hypothetical protein JNL70_04180 [Saprospiraceae bacterium]|nr:hypothetical protein [Saprospiraceae bacterium]
MKFFKFLLLTMICSFISPVTATYAVISRNHIGYSISTEKKNGLNAKQLKCSTFPFDPISKTEAIVMGIISLIGAIGCAIYVPILAAKGIEGLILGVALGMVGIALAICAIIYGIVLIKQSRKSYRK